MATARATHTATATATATVWLCLLLTVLSPVCDGSKKGRKEIRLSPKWRSSSMAVSNRKFTSLYEGDDLDLDCKAQAEPKPSIRWLKDGQELRDSDQFEVKKFSLQLRRLTTEMAGNYTCVVSNKFGQIEWTFRLDVQIKTWPLDMEGPHNVTQPVGSNVSFKCLVKNDPAAVITWQKVNGGSLDHEQNTVSLPVSGDPRVLRLANIQKSDQGQYECVVRNIWGSRSSSAWLTAIESVIVPELSRSFETDRRRNRNSNNPGSDTKHRKFNPLDQVDPVPGGADNSFYDDSNQFMGGHFDPDMFFTTTRRPKNPNNRKKSGQKKTNKDRDRFLLEDDDFASATQTSFRVQLVTSKQEPSRSTQPEIWNFGDDLRDDYGLSDTRYGQVRRNMEDSPVDATEGGSLDLEYVDGGISVWTIYTIIGAISGVVILVGLTALTLLICCRREEVESYKNVSV